MDGRIKCKQCNKTQAHPMCCDQPMEFKNASWICKHCDGEEEVQCCDETMVPETEKDVDLPEEVVEQFEDMIDEVEQNHEHKKKTDYIG